MSKHSTTPLQRGAVLGLALLFSLPVVAGSTLREIKRQYRDQSFVLIEEAGEQRIILVKQGLVTISLLSARSVTDVDKLYELVDRGDPAAIFELISALDDPSRDVRMTTIRLLGELDSLEARLALQQVLGHDDVEMRMEVVESIVDTPGTNELLRLAAGNDSEAVASAAREYLAERTGN